MHVFEIIFQRLKNGEVSKNYLRVPGETPYPLPEGSFSGQITPPLFCFSSHINKTDIMVFISKGHVVYTEYLINVFKKSLFYSCDLQNNM